MKTDKRLAKLVTNLVKLSVDKNARLVDNKVDEFSKALSKLPRHQAIAALSEYLKKLKMELSKTTLSIESPLELSKQEIGEIEKSFARDYVVTKTEVITDSSLLGGLRVKIGDLTFDDSVRAKIDQVKAVING